MSTSKASPALSQLTVDNVQILPDCFDRSAARVMANAFVNSPSYVQIFRESTTERSVECLSWLFERNICAVRKKVPDALRGIVINDQDVVATFFLVPTTAKLSLWEMILAGLIVAPFKFGVSTFQRLLHTIDWFDEHFVKYIPPIREGTPTNNENVKPTRVTLERMTVLPEFQGQGLGTLCLQKCYQEAMQRNLHIVLSTQEERNVRFYNKNKFKVRGGSDFPVPDDDANFSYHAWFMDCYPGENEKI